ncbi:MAG: amidohydrolase family protein [Anaerolineae bacterium]
MINQQPPNQFRQIALLLLVVWLASAMAGCGPAPTPIEAPAKPPTIVPTTAPTAPASTPISSVPAENQGRSTPVFEAESGQPLALIHGTLIDGTGTDPLPDAALVIQEGRILAVGPHAEVEVPIDAKIIDLQGATILPGFINAHVHLGYSEHNLQAWAEAGVTTVRDLGTAPASDLFSRRDELLKDNRNARLVAAGPLVTVPDGYPMVPWGLQGLAVTSAQDAALKVNQLLDDGADVIKIALESGYLFETNIPVLSAQEAATVVKVAHERGTMVSAHVTAAQDLGLALDAGVDDIAHMVTNNLSHQLIEGMLKNDVYWVPTLELWKGVGGLDRQAVANLRKFVEAGGKVALGTDYAGYSSEFDLGMPITEMELMGEAGMTPMQIILAGTQNAAHVCNLDRELGTLETGKIADVLVVDGNPLEDIHALTDARIVIHNGVVIRGGNEE